jgi:hypothetical protein
MGRPSDDYAVLLKGADTVEIDLARGLLREAGIPHLVHGSDFDVAELGVAAHHMVRGSNLYVPHELRDRARDVLKAAWGPIDEEGRPQTRPGGGETA